MDIQPGDRGILMMLVVAALPLFDDDDCDEILDFARRWGISDAELLAMND
jgi:hypothetical protein